jgi:hypothetical protein
MKKIVTVMVFSLVFVINCVKTQQVSEDVSDQKKETNSFVPTEQEISANYIFDIDTFGYLEEYPQTIAGIKELYPDEQFDEKEYPST